MKILFDCALPFALAHGGWATQIQQTKAALEAQGVEVEYLRWWDERQTGDLIHYFGRVPAGQVAFAHQKGIKVAMAELLTGPGSRTMAQLRVQKIISRAVERFAPQSFTSAFNWESYRTVDAVIALTSWEAHLMQFMFGAPAGRVHVVPNGVEEVFINSPRSERGKWLVCTSTITERKRVLELAEAAVQAQTPIWIIGKAYADTEPYAQKFVQLARQHPQFLRFEGPIYDRSRLAQIYHEARGFVLLSAMETQSLSAMEAAACDCPLLLSDLPWARSTFLETAAYCPVTPECARTARTLQEFYAAAPRLPGSLKPLTWDKIGGQLKGIYEGVLRPSK